MKQKLSKITPFGVYFHWPFCLSKCPYCDFFSRVKKDINQEIQDDLRDNLTFYNPNALNKRLIGSELIGLQDYDLVDSYTDSENTGHLEKRFVRLHKGYFREIFDEIQSGMGRTGHIYAFQEEGLDPDMLLLGKAL